MKILLFFSIFICILLSVSGEEWQKAKIRFEKTENLVITETMAAIPVFHIQKPGSPLKIEGEGFDSVELQDSSVKILDRAECSGGKSLTRARMLAYRFRIVTPGKYTVWMKSSFPIVAGWNHSERMDGGEIRKIIDSNRRPANLWHYYHGAVYNLSAGDHFWEFPSPGGWCGGVELDYAMLVPENASQMEGISNPQLSKSGFAIGRRIKTERIKQWKCIFSTEANSGKILMEYSYDKKNFSPVESDKIYVPKGEYLYFRIRMSTGEKSFISPWLYHLRFFIIRKVSLES